MRAASKQKRRLSPIFSLLVFAITVFMMTLAGFKYLGSPKKNSLQIANKKVQKHVISTIDENSLNAIRLKKAPSPKVEKITATEKDSIKDSYTIELGVVTNEKQASDKVNALEKHGIPTFYTPLHIKGQILYRIRTGIFSSSEEANPSLETLKRLGFKSSKVQRL